MPADKVIIDTDPGLDDALAIILALRSPELEILGIVTVAGNVSIATTTDNTLKLLDFLGRPDIPVAVGASAPLRRPAIDAAAVHGDDGMGGVPLPPARCAPASADGQAWMIETLERHPPGSIRILALGPLTNIARLIETRPDVASRLGGIIAMGGAVRQAGNVTPFAEFNFAADPEAADIVLRSKLPLILVPLDVTRQVIVTRAWGERLRSQGHDIGPVVAQIIHAYLDNIAAFQTTRGIVHVDQVLNGFPLHDPCVMIAAVDASIFTSEVLPLRVITDDSERFGASVIETGGTNVQVLTGVDNERALDFTRKRFGGS